MATSVNASTQWTARPSSKTHSKNLLNKWTAFMESQSGNGILWFLVSMVFQGVFFLPLPALLIYYYDAPKLVLGITLSLFFANIIAGMGGAGVKTLLKMLAASIIIHLLMAIICIM
jgi:RsiW-degrading membrane proteinase PrsW (M82 family)